MRWDEEEVSVCGGGIIATLAAATTTTTTANTDGKHGLVGQWGGKGLKKNLCAQRVQGVETCGVLSKGSVLPGGT